jgi:hypothetical protein
MLAAPAHSNPWCSTEAVVCVVGLDRKFYRISRIIPVDLDLGAVEYPQVVTRRDVIIAYDQRNSSAAIARGFAARSASSIPLT